MSRPGGPVSLYSIGLRSGVRRDTLCGLAAYEGIRVFRRSESDGTRCIAASDADYLLAVAWAWADRDRPYARSRATAGPDRDVRAPRGVRIVSLWKIQRMTGVHRETLRRLALLEGIEVYRRRDGARGLIEADAFRMAFLGELWFNRARPYSRHPDGIAAVSPSGRRRAT